MHRTAAAAVATVVTAGITLVAVAPGPASAEVTRFRDPVRDTPRGVSYGDVTAVRVDHGIGNVEVDLRTHGADVQTLWVDSDAADPGPEHVVTFSAEVPRPQVFAVDDFSRARVLGSDPAFYDDRTCTLPRAQVVRSRRGNTVGYRFSVPRACLGRPARVRVALQVAMDFPGTTHDWAPARETFGPWTRSGPVS